MTRSTKIVLGTPAAPLAPETKARALPAVHWRNWRRGGVLLSALLHVLVVTALTMSVPVFGGPAEQEDKSIPVEIVQRAPETKAEEPKKPEPPQRIPEPPKPEPAPPSVSAAKPAPAPATPRAEVPPPAPTPAQPPVPPAPPAMATPAPATPQAEAPSPTPTPAPPVPPAPPAMAAPKRPLPPESRAVPDPPRPQGPEEGQKVDADEVPPPGDKAGLGYWVLDPLTANLGHRCGLARITGVLELKQRLAEGRYRGTMRTRIGWALCPAEGVVHQVELRIDRGEVQMIGANGFVDRGVIGTNTMLLEDRYGRSIWKKR